MTVKRVSYTEFSPDLSERVLEGEIWSAAPRAGTYWVLPAGEQWPPILVARALRRLRVGAVVNGRWDARGGRWVEKDDWYTETSLRSKIGAETRRAANRQPPPRMIRMKPLPQHDMASLSGM